jgi:hypothetical protein
VADSHTFTGKDHTGPPNPSLDGLTIGQTVIVYYDREHPEVSVLEDPKPCLDNETATILMEMVITPR